MRITCEEEYFHMLERIVKGAEFLDNPLIQPEDYKKGLAKYERLCSAVINWNAAHKAS